MKKNIKNMLATGVGLGVGSVVVSKVGGDSEVANSLQQGFGVASLALPVMGAKSVLDATDSLYGKRKKGGFL